jgi:hypothetical protein
MFQLMLTTCEGPVLNRSTRAVGTTPVHVDPVGYAHVERVHGVRAVPVMWRDLPMSAVTDLIARPFAKARKALRPPRGSP